MSKALPDLTRKRLEETYDKTELEMFGKTIKQMQIDGDEDEHGTPLYWTARFDVMEVMAKRLVKNGYSVKRIESAFECWGEDKRPSHPREYAWRPFWITEELDDEGLEARGTTLPRITNFQLESLYRKTSLENFGKTIEQIRRLQRFEPPEPDDGRMPTAFEGSRVGVNLFFEYAHNSVLNQMMPKLVDQGYSVDDAIQAIERWRSPYFPHARAYSDKEPLPSRMDLIDLAKAIRAQIRRRGELVITSVVIDRLADLVKNWRRMGRGLANRASVIAMLRFSPELTVSGWHQHVQAERISRLYAAFEDLANNPMPSATQTESTNNQGISKMPDLLVM